MPCDDFEVRDHERVEYLGACGAELIDGGVDDRRHLAVVFGPWIGAGVHRLAHHAEPRTAEAGRVERCGIRARDLARGLGRDRVVGVVAGNRIEQDRRVGHCPGDRSHRVVGGVRGHHPERAHEL